MFDRTRTQSLNNPNRRSRASVWLIALASLLALVVLPTVGYIAINTIRRVTTGTNGAAPVQIQVAPGAAAALGGWTGQERVNILLLGIDQRPGENAEQTRSDSMIVLTIDPATKTAGMLSIPRDLYVSMLDGRLDRINTAHALGGPKNAMKTVEYNFGLPIHHYMRINFAGVIALIDLVGGIDVYVDQAIDDPAYPDNNYGYDPFKIAAGFQHLDGATALKYARTRHGANDFYRIRRQQQVIMAVRDKAQDPATFAALIAKAPQVRRTLAGSFDTDLNQTELVQLALLAKGINKDKISRVALDETATQYWTTPTGASVLIPIRDRVRQLRDLLYAVPAPSQAAAATLEPGQLAIQNGTKTVGLAGGAKTYLESRGFRVLTVGDAPQVTDRTVVVDQHNRPDYAKQVAEALGISPDSVTSAYDPNSTVDALVILGPDYQPR
jgi:LCP family protein required for cell wall assembly